MFAARRTVWPQLYVTLSYHIQAVCGKPENEDKTAILHMVAQHVERRHLGGGAGSYSITNLKNRFVPDASSAPTSGNVPPSRVRLVTLGVLPSSG